MIKAFMLIIYPYMLHCLHIIIIVKHWPAFVRLWAIFILCFQVEARDEEIDRLTKMLDGGRPSDVVSLDAKNRANERMISHLNIQVSCCCCCYCCAAKMLLFVS